MVVRMRLQRFGCRNLPFYRIVVADARAPRDGKFLENLGTYNPIPMKDMTKEITANGDRVRYWLSVGAQPSDRVAWLLGKVGLVPPRPLRVSLLKSLPKEEQKDIKAAAAAAKAAIIAAQAAKNPKKTAAGAQKKTAGGAGAAKKK